MRFPKGLAADAHIGGLAVEAVFAALRTSETGLTRAEAARRGGEFGRNEIEELGGEGLPIRFLREFGHFFAVILWIAAGLCFVAEHYGPGEGMARLGIAIVGVIVVNGIFSFWQEYRAERAIAALRTLLPRTVSVVREATTVAVDAAELVPGDVIVVDEGTVVPADCRVIAALGLRVNMATITGESVPQPRSSAASAASSPLEARNLLLAGTAVVAGQGRAVVYATGMHTEFGRIAGLAQATGDAPTPLQREIARLSRLVAVLALGIGTVFFAIGNAVGLPFWANFLFAVGIIVANVPEGLLPTVTLALALATQRMAKRNALVRHLPAVEALGSTTVICCDKTGTLTQNRMSVRSIWLDGAASDGAASDVARAGAQSPDIAPCALAAPGAAPSGLGPAKPRHRQLLVNAALCHNLKEVVGRAGRHWAGDPMELALAQMGWDTVGDLAGFVRRDELPFDSERMRMSVLCDTPDGPVLYCKGAPESVLAACTGIDTAAGMQALDEAARGRVAEAQRAMTEAGLRVLAFAYRPMAEGEPMTEQQLALSGLVGLEDPPRPEVGDAVARCRAAGIRVIMVTGDHPATAVAIARQVGIAVGDAPEVIDGEALHRMSPAQLQLMLDAPEVVFARVAAEQKMQIVAALQKKGEVVAVTGDGVNDAPALRAADIGVAMGLSGTDVAREAADVVLLDDNLASIVTAIEEGRAVFENIRKFLTYILTSNIPELVPYLAFVLLRIPLPLTVIQILAVDLGTDIVPALALGAERPDPDVMRRPPRPVHEPLLTWGIAVRAYLFLGPLEAAAALAAFFGVLVSAGWEYGDALARLDPVYLRATTACLAAIVLMQVVNVFLCRHPLRSSLSFPIAGNRLLLAGIAFELALLVAIVYTPAGHWAFGTAPLEPVDWLPVLPLAAVMWLLDELRKALLRRTAAPGNRAP